MDTEPAARDRTYQTVSKAQSRAKGPGPGPYMLGARVKGHGQMTWDIGQGIRGKGSGARDKGQLKWTCDSCCNHRKQKHGTRDKHKKRATRTTPAAPRGAVEGTRTRDRGQGEWRVGQGSSHRGQATAAAHREQAQGTRDKHLGPVTRTTPVAPRGVSRAACARYTHRGGGLVT